MKYTARPRGHGRQGDRERGRARSCCRLPVRVGSASSAIQSRERSSCGASSYSTGPSCGARAAVDRSHGFRCLTVAHVGSPETHSQECARWTVSSLHNCLWAALHTAGAQPVYATARAPSNPSPGRPRKQCTHSRLSARPRLLTPGHAQPAPAGAPGRPPARRAPPAAARPGAAPPGAPAGAPGSRRPAAGPAPGSAPAAPRRAARLAPRAVACPQCSQPPSACRQS
jgi:hypothetical protein